MNAVLSAMKGGQGGRPPGNSEGDGYSPQQTQLRRDSIGKLLALLNAQGVSMVEISEICGLPIDALTASSENDEAYPRRVMEYSVKLNQPLDIRIKAAANIAMGRLLQVLVDPTAGSKEVISAAKEMLDRHLGKSIQKLQVDGAISVDGDFTQLQKDIKASDARIEALMAERQKLLAITEPTRKSEALEVEATVIG